MRWRSLKEIAFPNTSEALNVPVDVVALGTKIRVTAITTLHEVLPSPVCENLRGPDAAAGKRIPP